VTVIIGFALAEAMLCGLVAVLLVRHVRRRRTGLAMQGAQHLKVRLNQMQVSRLSELISTP